MWLVVEHLAKRSRILVPNNNIINHHEGVYNHVSMSCLTTRQGQSNSEHAVLQHLLAVLQNSQYGGSADSDNFSRLEVPRQTAVQCGVQTRQTLWADELMDNCPNVQLYVFSLILLQMTLQCIANIVDTDTVL